MLKRRHCHRRCPRRYRSLRVEHTCALASWGEHEAAAQEIEVCSAKHLAFQHLEAIDMALDRSIGPGHGHPGFDRIVILRQPLRKASQSLQRTGGCPLEPRIEGRGLPLADQLRKVLRQVDRLGHLGRLRVELGELLCLHLRARGFTPQDQSRRPARRERWGCRLSHDGERLAPALTAQNERTCHERQTSDFAV